MDGRRLYDISPPVGPGFAVFPGDTPPERHVLLDMGRGDALTLSTLRTTVHAGAHADAPSHYGLGAPSIDRVPLERYLGPCRVVIAEAPRGQRLRPEHLRGPIDRERILLATGSWPDPTAFNPDFNALSVDLVEHLADRGVVTVGIDTPSVDTADSRDLPAHRALLRRDVAILECLDLSAVPPGVYELIALPLRLVGFEASPVRAVLRPVAP